MKARYVWAGVLCSLGIALACSNDFDRFELTGGPSVALGGSSGAASPTGGNATGALGGSSLGGTSGRGGAGGRGGTAGASTGRGGGAGAAGVAGTTNGEAGVPSTLTCTARQKECGDACVALDDPATSCADPASCSACSMDHATATCSAGACAPGRCDEGFQNCNSAPDDGCETDVAGEAQTCGDCSNDCTVQGLGVCTDGLCGCGSRSQCGNGSGVECVGGRCSCDDVVCRAGERCAQSGPDRVCACNGGAACGPEEACCDTPSGCVDVLTSATSCGACGRACADGFVCANGHCECDSDQDCGAGADASGSAGGGGEGGAANGPRCVSGRCLCDSAACSEDELCVASGACG